MNPEKENTPTPREQLGILIRPNNLLKTVGTLIPLSSPLVEMQNQIEGAQLDQRLKQVETGLEAFKSDKSASKTPVPRACLDKVDTNSGGFDVV
jgi:hypothetical protein